MPESRFIRYSVGVVLAVMVAVIVVAWFGLVSEVPDWLVILLFILLGAAVIVMLRRLTQINQALQNAKQYADDLVGSAPDALVIINRSGDIVRANFMAQELFGYSNEELTQLNLSALIPHRFRSQHEKYISHAFGNGKAQPMAARAELLALNKQGEEFPVEIGLSYTSQDGELQSIAAIRDIRKRKQAETRLRLMSKVLEETSEGIMITDSAVRIVDMNEAFCELTGYSREELLGQNPSMLKSGRHDKTFYENLWQNLNEQGHWRGEIWDRRKNGELIPNIVSISAVADSSGEISQYVAVFSDITQIKEKEERLEYMAHYDQLTGLANRMLFHDRLASSMRRVERRGGSCAVLYIDLDGFKPVNDLLGHEVGDVVLKNVGDKIAQVVRGEDTAARIGGDEFVIICNDMQQVEKATVLAARVLESLTFVVDPDGEALPLSASIGIALYPEDGDSVDVLLKHADQAMYYCKHHGKHSYCRFDAELHVLEEK